MSGLKMMLRINKDYMKVSTQFKDLVMKDNIGLMLREEMPFGTFQIGRIGQLEVQIKLEQSTVI